VQLANINLRKVSIYWRLFLKVKMIVCAKTDILEILFVFR